MAMNNNAVPDQGPGTRHPQYRELENVRRLVRDADSGQEAVLSRASTYVPQPAGLVGAEYTHYVTRPTYYAAVERTLESGTGIAFREPPAVTTAIPEDDQRDIDLQDNGIEQFARVLFRDLLLVGTAAIVVDVNGDGRPYWRRYKAEDLLSWRYSNRVLEQAVVHDVTYTPDPRDQYRLVEVHELTEYRLSESVALHWVNDRGKWIEAAPASLLSVLGEPVDALPVFIARIGDGRPPMRGLANKTMEHFRLSCDLMHTLHWAATPQPYVAGVGARPAEDQGKARVIGSSELWELPEGATADYMEFSGSGASEMREQIVRLEAQMAAIGARLLSEPTAGVEAAETVRLKMLADTALLVLTSIEVSKALTWAVQMYERLAGIGDGGTVELPRDIAVEPVEDPATGSGGQPPEGE